MVRRIWLLCAVVALVGLIRGWTAYADSDPTPQRAIEQLNEWRARVGVAPVTEDPAQTEGCRLHAIYWSLNATEGFGHFETPSLPGSTPEGIKAASSSVLAHGAPNGPYAWEEGVFHRTSLLQPWLATTGFWSEYGMGCMGVQGLSRARTIPQFAAYPYPTDGQVDVPPAFRCNESPDPCLYVPGNDGRTPTGFISSMQFNGPWEVMRVSVSDASVVPDGGAPVAVVTLDSSSPAGPNLDDGIAVIPVHPLVASQWYTATAQGTVDSDAGLYPFAVTWRFRTAAPTRSRQLSVDADIDGGVHVRTFGPGPVRITTSSTRGAGPTTTVTPAAISGEQAYAADARLALGLGDWTVCADQDIDLINDYVPEHVCTTIKVYTDTGPKTVPPKSPPSSRRLTAPRHLTARRKGGKVRLSWSKVAQAKRYRVGWQVGRRTVTRTTTKRSLVVTVRRSQKLVASVRAIDRAGRLGATAHVTLRRAR